MSAPTLGRIYESGFDILSRLIFHPHQMIEGGAPMNLLAGDPMLAGLKTEIELEATAIAAPAAFNNDCEDRERQ